MKHPNRSESGQILVIIVFALVGLVGITGLAIDGSAAYADRRQAQNAADSASLAAALSYVRGSDWNAVALQRAASNGYDNNQESNTVQAYHPPASGVYAGNDEYIQVIITSTSPTTFAGLVGVRTVNNTVEAVTRVTLSSAEPPYYGEAIVALKPDGRGAFRSHGNNDINVLGGSVFVNSNDEAAFEQMGHSTMSVPAGVNIVGDYRLNGAITTDTLITTDAATEKYPPSSLPPEPQCADAEGNPIAAAVHGNTMTPGNWEGLFPPRGVTLLESGIYCIDGMFMLNGHDELTGHEVMFYMRSGNIHWNGNSVQVDLTPPPANTPYEGMLIYMPMSNDEGIILNGNAEATISGTVFAPASDIQINGTGSTQSYQSQFIGYTVDLIGDADATVNYDAEGKYNFPPPTVIQFVK